MFSEKVCLENLKHIVFEYADDETIKHLSLDELRPGYEKIAGNIFCISVSNRLKYKNMLWNIENLKTEIRSKFQAELFNTWHSVYLNSLKVDSTRDPGKLKSKGSTLVAKVEKGHEFDPEKQTSAFMERHPIPRENQKKTTSNENTDLIRETKPVKKQSPISTQKGSVHKFENDWFDKLLDFFAAIVCGVL